MKANNVKKPHGSNAPTLFDQPRPLEKRRGEPKKINASGTQTSSFQDEERRGRISRRQAQILDLLREREGITNREAATLLSTFPSNLTAAFKNLEVSGRLVVRSEKDNVTGKRAMVYELARA